MTIFSPIQLNDVDHCQIYIDDELVKEPNIVLWLSVFTTKINDTSLVSHMVDKNDISDHTIRIDAITKEGRVTVMERTPLTEEVLKQLWTYKCEEKFHHNTTYGLNFI